MVQLAREARYFHPNLLSLLVSAPILSHAEV